MLGSFRDFEHWCIFHPSLLSPLIRLHVTARSRKGMSRLRMVHIWVCIKRTQITRYCLAWDSFWKLTFYYSCSNVTGSTSVRMNSQRSKMAWRRHRDTEGERREERDSPGLAARGEGTVTAGYTSAIQANVAIFKDVQINYPDLELPVSYYLIKTTLAGAE